MKTKLTRQREAADRLRDRIIALKKNYRSMAHNEDWLSKLTRMEIELQNIETKLRKNQ